MEFMYNSITSIADKRNKETGLNLNISLPFKFVVNIDFSSFVNFFFTFVTCLFPTTFIWLCI